MEIEYKYLLKKAPTDLDKYPKLQIKQGYISTDPVIRLRQSNDDFLLTIKGKGHVFREEYELGLTKEQFDNLWVKVETETIEKTRYLVPLSCGHTGELDVFDRALKGLMTIEVEFATMDEANAFEAPEWFGKDVTREPAYKNNNLIRYGLPTGHDL